MKKSISCALAAFLALGMVGAAGCGDKEGAVVVPTFTDKNGGVVFGAYGTPTINRSIENLPEDAYDKLGEAGFTKAWALYEGSSSATGADVFETIRKRSKVCEDTVMKLLPYAEKAGVKYYVKDWSYYGLVRDFNDRLTSEADYDRVMKEMFTSENPYLASSGYGGNICFDEPNVQEMSRLPMQIKAYNKYMAELGVEGEAYVNLLPGYVADNSASLSEDLSYTYREYVDYYFDNIAPLVGYVCYDFYPFMQNASGENYIRDNYYYNYELMAQHCKEGDYELRIIIQSHGDWTGLRNLTSIAEFRWQIYSGMAFGTREFTYYTYGGSEYTPSDVPKGSGFSLYNRKTGEYNWTYDAAKTVNNEVHAMENAYAAYAWDGVMYNHASEMIDNQLFMNLTNPLESHPRIAKVESTLDTLIGTFKVKEGEENPDAFMFVNSNDPDVDKNDQVTVQFNDARALLMYRLGQKIVVPLNKDGTYTFNLYPGEGRFVIPLK